MSGTGAAGAARVAVEVEVPRLLRESVPLPEPLRAEGRTLREAIDDLLARHPLLRVHLYEETGRLRRHVLLYLNDENSAWLPSLDVPLAEGDRISVLQAVSGG